MRGRTATDEETLQGFVRDRVKSGAPFHTDNAEAYQGITGFRHESVNQFVGKFVRDMAHTNGT